MSTHIGRRGAPRPFDVFRCDLDGINLIEASAGTGKTWNICGLYLRLLLERGLTVQSILVVTFTNAATGELRERVRARIVEALLFLRAGAPADTGGDPFVPRLLQEIERRLAIPRSTLAQRLDEALHCFDEAAIFTIHGFCQRTLADTPFSAGLPFSTELITDAGEMILDAVNDFWRRRVASEACPPELSAHLLQRGDCPERFARLLARGLAKPLAKYLWPSGVEAPATNDGPAIVGLSRLDAAYAGAAATWADQREAIVARLKHSLTALNGNVYKPPAVEQAAREWDAWFRAANALSLPPTAKKLDLLSSSRQAACTKKGQSTPDHAFFDQASELLDAHRNADGEIALARLRLIRAMLSTVGPELRRRKREQRVVAYDDMLYNLYAALEGDSRETLAASLRARFPVALIDEFQDTDPLQFAIFHRIYGNDSGSAFLVGDPKQAIYSFRNADLHAYLRARLSARNEYTLVHNQRSSRGLITALNGLFSANPAAFMLGGLHYRDVAMGDRSRQRFVDATAPRADLQVWMIPPTADGQPLLRHAARAHAGRATAAEIARLIVEAAAGRITIDGRPLTPGDIAVLVRTHAQGSEIKRELAALDVGSVELAQASVFQSSDAEEVERVLIAVHQPSRDTLLRAALATEMLGCDAIGIAEISASEDRLVDYLERFASWRETWRRQGVGVMFRRILSEQRVGARMLRRPDGERRLTNLLHLGELIHQAAATHPSPDALLRWLQAQRREASADEAVQLRLESDRNLVQIVTIHKAKGLEFPVVFCPFLWEGGAGFGGPSPEGREYHDDDGAAVIDFRGAEQTGVDEDEIKARIRLEQSAERLRLVYVALTRAVHRCYLIAGTYAARTFGKPSTLESTRSLLNWLVAGGGKTPDAWFGERRSPVEIERAWRALGDSLAPHAALAPLPSERGAPVVLKQPAAEALVPLAPPKSIAAAWRFGSFSSLIGEARREDAADDHDARTPASAKRVEAPIAGIAEDDILRFPSGPSAGECLHAVFERADYSNPAGWDEAISRSLFAHPQALPRVRAPDQVPLLARMASRMLADVTATTLPGGIVLASVARNRRLAELEFSLPAPAVSPRRVNDTLKRLGYEVPRLTFVDFEGYLKGYIDLVFEHHGRYYVLDWKSNHLGYTAADYGPGPIDAAMRAHGYHLQYLLYCLALDRYLNHRLPGYRRDTHLGGVFYLFVRGVRPGWDNPDGTPSGVFHHRPTAATLAALGRLFAPSTQGVSP